MCIIHVVQVGDINSTISKVMFTARVSSVGGGDETNWYQCYSVEICKWSNDRVVFDTMFIYYNYEYVQYEVIAYDSIECCAPRLVCPLL